MEDIIELGELQIEGNITGSIEDIIEFFVDFKNSYNNMFKLDPGMVRRLCLTEPSDSPIKFYSGEEMVNDKILKKLDNNRRESEIVYGYGSGKEKRKIVDQKLNSLLENYPLKITKLNYNSQGVMVVLGAYFVLKSIVEIIDKFLDMDGKRANNELTEANVKLVEAKTNRENAEAEKAYAEVERIRKEATTNELVSPKDMERIKSIDNMIDSYSSSLAVFSKYTKKGFITSAKIIQKNNKK